MMVKPKEHRSQFRGDTGPPGSVEPELPFRRDAWSESVPSRSEYSAFLKNVVELSHTRAIRNENKLMRAIVNNRESDNDDGELSCQELSPGLLAWLYDHGEVPPNVVTKLLPGGWKSTKAVKQQATYASSKQRIVSLKNAKEKGVSDVSRRPKHYKNSGIELDPRSYDSQMRLSLFTKCGLIKQICIISQLTTPNDYDGHGESFLPSDSSDSKGTLTLTEAEARERDLQVVSEIQQELQRIALEEAIANGYGTPDSSTYTMNTAGDRFLAEDVTNIPVVRKNLSYEKALASVNQSELTRYQEALYSRSVFNKPRYEDMKVYEEVASVKALARRRWKADGRKSEITTLSRKGRKLFLKKAKAEQKMNYLATDCQLSNSDKVRSQTGSPIVSLDSTLCVAAKYQLWLYKHEPMNKALHADRYTGAFGKHGELDYQAWLWEHANPDNDVPQELRGVSHEKSSQVKRSDFVHEVDYVSASRRNKTVEPVSLVPEVDIPWQNGQGTPTSLEAMNDPINPEAVEAVKAQEVYGPQIPDEVSEMRIRRQRSKCNLSVYKNGGMSRPRARIDLIREEAKERIRAFESSGAKAPVFYLGPRDEVNKPSVYDDDWADKFVKEESG